MVYRCSEQDELCDKSTAACARDTCRARILDSQTSTARFEAFKTHWHETGRLASHKLSSAHVLACDAREHSLSLTMSACAHFDSVEILPVLRIWKRGCLRRQTMEAALHRFTDSSLRQCRCQWSDASPVSMTWSIKAFFYDHLPACLHTHLTQYSPAVTSTCLPQLIQLTFTCTVHQHGPLRIIRFARHWCRPGCLDMRRLGLRQAGR